MLNKRDRELGMDRNVTRRDFLNGIALTLGAAALPAELHALLGDDAKYLGQDERDYDPPALTGLRGSHPGSFEVAHSLRDGNFFDQAGKAIDTNETYDLVVVGGGISGLSAALYYKQAVGEKARVLVLDNHDDFGGHAKRNEFHAGNNMRLGYGGTYSIESPWPYSTVAKGMIEGLGIDVPSYTKYFKKDLYRSLGLTPKIFFDKETFGADKLVANPAPQYGGETVVDTTVDNSAAWKIFLAEAPLSEKAKQDFQRLSQDRKDYFPGLSSDEKKAKLARISYEKYLSELVGVDPQVIRIYQTAPHPLFGVGIDAVSAQDAWGLGLPGFGGLNLTPSPGKGMNRDAIRNEEADRYFFHFPDGNASIARLIVRKLLPEAIPGNSVSDVVTAKANYAKLDQSSNSVRIRLNSTVVRVRHNGDAANAKNVEVAYSQAGKLRTVNAGHCILACWHVMIPYICQELPDKQKEALAYAQKVPLLYTNVELKNWTSFQKLAVNSVYAPVSYHTGVNLDLPVSIGDYECSTRPEEPIVVHMMKAACKPGKPARDQHRLGRIQLYSTTFDTFERNIRDQLARTLGPGGFDPARDIAAITVNRWPHGYAYEYNSLFDEFWLNGGETPCEVARKPFGRIAIANSDAAAYAYTDAAIDQAYRAVKEITATA